MTVGHAVVIAIVLYLAVTAAAAPFVMRYDNGHWGSGRWYETDFLGAWAASLFWAAVAIAGGMGLSLLVMILASLFVLPL